jgi:hypothetical protein
MLPGTQIAKKLNKKPLQVSNRPQETNRTLTRMQINHNRQRRSRNYKKSLNNSLKKCISQNKRNKKMRRRLRNKLNLMQCLTLLKERVQNRRLRTNQSQLPSNLMRARESRMQRKRRRRRNRKSLKRK